MGWGVGSVRARFGVPPLAVETWRVSFSAEDGGKVFIVGVASDDLAAYEFSSRPIEICALGSWVFTNHNQYSSGDNHSNQIYKRFDAGDTVYFTLNRIKHSLTLSLSSGFNTIITGLPKDGALYPLLGFLSSEQHAELLDYRWASSRPFEGQSTQIAAKRLRTQWESRLFTDAVLRCGEHHWPVHRSTLAAASAVLRRMFESSMVEGQTASITIKQCDAETIGEMLEFIYTGDAPVLRREGPQKGSGDRLVSLLEQANVYEMEDLSKACIAKLIASKEVLINEGNIVRILRSARDAPGHGSATLATLKRLLVELVSEEKAGGKLCEAIIRSL